MGPIKILNSGHTVGQDDLWLGSQFLLGSSFWCKLFYRYRLILQYKPETEQLTSIVRWLTDFPKHSSIDICCPHSLPTSTQNLPLTFVTHLAVIATRFTAPHCFNKPPTLVLTVLHLHREVWTSPFTKHSQTFHTNTAAEEKTVEPAGRRLQRGKHCRMHALESRSASATKKPSGTQTKVDNVCKIN